MTLHRRFRTILAAAYALPLCAALGQAGAAPSGQPVYFGQHILHGSTFDGLQDQLFDGLRIWGADGTTWRELEGDRGKFDFTRFDAYVAKATARRFDLLYTFGQTPRWASARPDEKGNVGLGAAAEPGNMRDWATYVRAVATRYKGRIGAYEVMNEPRVPEAMRSWSPGFFSGPVAKLAEMTAIVATEVRNIDPTAKIVCPSFDGFDGLKRLDVFLATGAGKQCDVIGFHYYLPQHSIDNLRAMVKETRRIAARHGLANLPIWDTETGLLIAEAGYKLQPKFPTGALDKMFGSAEAAQLAARVIVVSHVLGIERTYWFAHDTSWMGSTVADKRLNRLNPFGESLALLKRWIGGRTLRQCVDGGASMSCDVVGATGKTGLLYWGPARPPAVWRQAGYSTASYLNGDVVQLDADGAAPVPAQAGDVVFLAAPGHAETAAQP